MNKGRREEVSKLKHKKRCQAMGLKPSEHYAFKSDAKPCSCWVCRNEKFDRNKINIKRITQEEIDEIRIDAYTEYAI